MSPSDTGSEKGSACSLSGCDRPLMARGMCNSHYERWRKHGNTFDRSPLNPAYPTPEDAFAARTRPDGDCLIWTGYVNERGYGHIHVDGKRKRAHRYAWERVNGNIPTGKVLDHTCFNTSCVNVAHLRLASKSENGSNRATALSPGQTGYRNVVRDGGRFRVVIKKGGETINGGAYPTPEEAARAAETLRAEVFGAFAGAQLPKQTA